MGTWTHSMPRSGPSLVNENLPTRMSFSDLYDASSSSLDQRFEALDNIRPFQGLRLGP